MAEHGLRPAEDKGSAVHGGPNVWAITLAPGGYAKERAEGFTKALLEGMGGHADLQNDGAIMLNELIFFVAERVKELTGGQQHRTMVRPGSIRDFPIALVNAD